MNDPSPVRNGAEQPPKAFQGSSIHADQKGKTKFIRWLEDFFRQTLSTSGQRVAFPAR